MVIYPKDKEISSLCSDIVNQELDLKPDFQRGEVWSSGKKKLLIDSIMRDWHVPPIHIVILSDGKAEVLDGQQRLTAIREFVENKFAIDGNIEPRDQQILELHGKKYKDLDQYQKRHFDKYSIRIYEIKDYNHGEPSELFFRLNQTVKLTSSEARNSIYGDVRDDIKSLVSKMESYGVDKDVVGFSNSRMAYNDLLSRVCIYLEKGSIRAKIDDTVLNARYREDRVFEPSIISAVECGLKFFGSVEPHLVNNRIELNLTKASTLSWLIFICLDIVHGLVHEDFENEKYLTAFLNLETAKSLIRDNKKIPDNLVEFFGFPEQSLKEIIFIYIERCSSRVMSIGSLVIRDMIISISAARAGLIDFKDYEVLNSVIESLENGEDPKYIIEEASERWRV